MYPTRCAECGGKVGTSTAPIPFEFRGEVVEVRGVEHGRCEGCGEIYLDLDAAEAVQREAVRRARRARGLLTPDEIRGLRSTLRVSQAKLERLLGTGPKTIVRWEKGTVFQSATADKLMRLLAAKPELVALLQGQSETTELGLPAPRRKAG